MYTNLCHGEFLESLVGVSPHFLSCVLWGLNVIRFGREMPFPLSQIHSLDFEDCFLFCDVVLRLVPLYDKLAFTPVLLPAPLFVVT